jgi:YesN/AraC family two-component response regulator
VTVSEIADHYGYNVDYIGKLFKANFGLSLKKYIALQRLNLAKDLLLTTMLSVKQIAGEIGYEDENAFVKFFVYHEKMSPTVFRNNYFNTHINNR